MPPAPVTESTDTNIFKTKTFWLNAGIIIFQALTTTDALKQLHIPDQYIAPIAAGANILMRRVTSRKATFTGS
jgi:hypothetical protein